MDRRSYTQELFQITQSLPEANRGSFLSAFQASEKNPVVLYGFNIWLGWLGIDRFVVGDIVAGILKLFTLGGFGLWQLIDCFLIGSRARTKNIELARSMAVSFQAHAPAGSPPPPPGEATV